MKITRSSNIIQILLITLLSLIRPSYQTVYSCNASASCGCSTNSATLTRIVGGESATSAAWDWVVSISIADTYLCGGSILSSAWIITAAHCVNNYTASQITIYAGSNLPFSGTQTRVASRVIVYPSYNSVTYVNDLALLQLASPLIMSDPYVSSICLPLVSSATLSANEWPPANTTVVAIGWGRLIEGGSLASTLQQVTLQTIDYQASTCNPEIVDWHVQFCAGVSGGGKDTCQGDSGGPLMMFAPSRQWLLVGITSNGIGCAEANHMGVYTRVATFVSWINSYTNGSASTLILSDSTTLSSSTQKTVSTTSVSTLTSSVSTTLSSSTQETVSTTSVSKLTSSISTTLSSVTQKTASTASVSKLTSSVSATLSSSTRTTVSTTTLTVIHSHANAADASTFTVFTFVILNWLILLFC